MQNGEILGIVGGLGPLASAEFVKTIYEQSLGDREQDSPIVLMHSDPTFPDRTQALLAGECELSLRMLIDALNGLRERKASRIVICCVTIHHLLPRLPAELRSRIISLLDVIFELVAKSPKRHLLISSAGARKLRLYERHPQWQSLSHRIVMPDETDQAMIHDEIIYRIKGNRQVSGLIPRLESLLSRYDTDSFIAGCTEIHLLAKHIGSNGYEGRFGCIDPLMAIAQDLSRKRSHSVLVPRDEDDRAL